MCRLVSSCVVYVKVQRLPVSPVDLLAKSICSKSICNKSISIHRAAKYEIFEHKIFHLLLRHIFESVVSDGKKLPKISESVIKHKNLTVVNYLNTLAPSKKSTNNHFQNLTNTSRELKVIKIIKDKNRSYMNLMSHQGLSSNFCKLHIDNG